ncbi:MAG: DUF1080 domain-containing protein [Akkermansiaceae bacterium]|nr:DUF1080 domain-containing protein [Akkermansiaceae bacterium]
MLIQIPRLALLVSVLTGPLFANESDQWIPLFNGEDLKDWTPKFTNHPVGENPGKVFRVEDGKLVVSYDEVEKFNGFGHLFYKTPYSHYRIRAEFRFTGEQLEGGPDWAFRNNGLMLHCQPPETMALGRNFPASIEMQVWGNKPSLGEKFGNRHMGNLYTPGTKVMMDGEEVENTDSSSPLFSGLNWVTVEAEVRGDEGIVHYVNGEEVLRYQKPQLDDGTPLSSGYIAIQAETHPVEFRKIELLPLEGNESVPNGMTSLFNGEDFEGWKMHPGSVGHWTVIDGVIDCDARSEAPNRDDRQLWTEESYGDFELHVDWRITETPAIYDCPIILPDGSYKKDADGRTMTVPTPNADSGILLRGDIKSQCNIWCWPVGSGEVYGYRRDKNMPPEVRAGVTPDERADNPVGEWNRFIIRMVGDRLTVNLNGKTIIEDVPLPGVPESGPIGLQHHGGLEEDGSYNNASSLVQFRNLYLKKL